jgi:hypothetical protein
LDAVLETQKAPPENGWPASVFIKAITFGVITGLSKDVGDGSLTGSSRYTGELVIKCRNSVAAEGIKIDFKGYGMWRRLSIDSTSSIGLEWRFLRS